MTLPLPACGTRRAAACTRFRTTRAAWRVLKGRAADAGGSGLARVEVSVARLGTGSRAQVLRAGRLRPTTARRAARTFQRARLVGVRWSLRLPAVVPAGRYVMRVRAVDRAGNVSAPVTHTRVLR